MPVETHNQCHKRYKNELDHIIKEVLDQEDHSDIEKALKSHQFKNVLDLVSSTDGEINALDFIDENGDLIELKTYKLAKFCLF